MRVGISIKHSSAGARADGCGKALGRLEGAAAASGEAKQQTLVQINPGCSHSPAVKTLTRLASRVEGGKSDHIAPGLEIQL
jgi:hypothetical protein